MPEQVDHLTDLMQRVWRCAVEAVRDGHMTVINAPPGCFLGEWTGEQGQRDATVALAYLRFRRNGPASRSHHSNAMLVLATGQTALEKLDGLAAALVYTMVKETRPAPTANGNWHRRDLEDYGRKDLDSQTGWRLLKTREGPDLGTAAEPRMRAYIATIKCNLLVDMLRRQQRAQRIETKREQQHDAFRVEASRQPDERQRIGWDAKRSDSEPDPSRLPAPTASSNVLPAEDLSRIGGRLLAHAAPGKRLLAHERTIAFDQQVSAARAGLWLLDPLANWSHEVQRKMAAQFESFWSEVVTSNPPPTRRAELPGILMVLKIDQDLKLGCLTSADAHEAMDVTQANFHQLCSRMRTKMTESVARSQLEAPIKLLRHYLILRCFGLRETMEDHERLLAPEEEMPA